MSWVAAATAAVGLGTSIYTGVKANQKQKQAEKDAKFALANQPQYQPNQSSRNLLSDALTSRNAINPAIQLMERQAQQGMANQIGNAQRNATSGAEALSVGSQAQSNLNSLLPQLAAQQSNFNMMNRENLQKALMNMSDEERMAFQSKLGRNADMFNFNLGMAGANNQNKGQAMEGGLMALLQAMNMMQGKL